MGQYGAIVDGNTPVTVARLSLLNHPISEETFPQIASQALLVD